MTNPARVEAAENGHAPLPGFEVLSRGAGGPTSQIEIEAREYIEHLIELRVYGPMDRLAGQLVLDLARTVGIGARTGKAAGVALAARQLMDAMDRLPKPPERPELTEFQRVIELIEGGPTRDDG